MHSTRVKAELLRRDASGAWPENPEVIDTSGVIHLASIGLDLPLAEAYAQTHLHKS